jgi:cytochrome c2
MPYSLRFLFALLAIAALFAVGGTFVAYRQGQRTARENAEALTGGDSAAGKLLIGRYGCGGCHEIPGIDGAQGRAGPPLDDVAVRTVLAGRLPNDPANMVRWLRDPQGVVPGNGMPDLGVSDKDARDMSAYLYTLTPKMPPP